MHIGVGIIGTGVMGADHARTLARSVQGARLVALCDEDLARAERLAGETGAPAVTGDPVAFVERAEVDAVLIASPDDTHAALVLACLRAGKPVLCEKPLAPSAEACWSIVEAELALGRRLVQVGFMRRFDPGYEALRTALLGEAVGRPLALHCIHRNASSPPWFTSAMLISNSAVHEIDVARWLLGDEFARASVFAAQPPSGAALREPQLLVMHTRGGVLVAIEVFVNAGYGYDVRTELVGSKGAMTQAPRPPVSLRAGGPAGGRHPGGLAGLFRGCLPAAAAGLGGCDPGGRARGRERL